jgi:hypothetical protein
MGANGNPLPFGNTLLVTMIVYAHHMCIVTEYHNGAAVKHTPITAVSTREWLRESHFSRPL